MKKSGTLKKRSDYQGVDRICLNCSKKYNETKKRRLIFCSLKCSGMYKKEIYICKNCKVPYLTTHTRNTVFCSRKCMGMFNIGKVRPSWVGEKITISKLAGREISESRRIRKLAKFSKVRKQMLIRDNFTCQICFESGIDAHHIKTVRDFPELAYNLSNLITLCKKCHDKKVSKHEKEWEEYFLKARKSIVG